MSYVRVKAPSGEVLEVNPVRAAALFAQGWKVASHNEPSALAEVPIVIPDPTPRPTPVPDREPERKVLTASEVNEYLAPDREALVEADKPVVKTGKTTTTNRRRQDSTTDETKETKDNG